MKFLNRVVCGKGKGSVNERLSASALSSASPAPKYCGHGAEPRGSTRATKGNTAVPAMFEGDWSHHWLVTHPSTAKAQAYIAGHELLGIGTRIVIYLIVLNAGMIVRGHLGRVTPAHVLIGCCRCDGKDFCYKGNHFGWLITIETYKTS